MKRWIIGLFVPLMASCDVGPSEPWGTPGALKAGGFLFCEDVSEACETVPDHIAVGTVFQISFSDGIHDVTLSSSDTAVLEGVTLTVATVFGIAEVQAFRALTAGNASVEARAGGGLVDFVRLNLEDASSLDLELCTRWFNAVATNPKFGPSSCNPRSQVSRIDVSLGSSLAPTVCGFPLDDSGNALAGRLPLDWTVAEGSTAELEVMVAEDSRCANVGGLTTGNATVTVTSNSTSATFDMTVKP